MDSSVVCDGMICLFTMKVPLRAQKRCPRKMRSYFDALSNRV